MKGYPVSPRRAIPKCYRITSKLYRIHQSVQCFILIGMLSRIRRVALIYDATMAYDMRVIGGVAAYLQEGTKWNVYMEENALQGPAASRFSGLGR